MPACNSVKRCYQTYFKIFEISAIEWIESDFGCRVLDCTVTVETLN